jgi:hypothetical protein
MWQEKSGVNSGMYLEKEIGAGRLVFKLLGELVDVWNRLQLPGLIHRPYTR